jgi:hypothetical protein
VVPVAPSFMAVPPLAVLPSLESPVVVLLAAGPPALESPPAVLLWANDIVLASAKALANPIIVFIFIVRSSWVLPLRNTIERMRFRSAPMGYRRSHSDWRCWSGMRWRRRVHTYPVAPFAATMLSSHECPGRRNCGFAFVWAAVLLKLGDVGATISTRLWNECGGQVLDVRWPRRITDAADVRVGSNASFWSCAAHVRSFMVRRHVSKVPIAEMIKEAG